MVTHDGDTEAQLKFPSLGRGVCYWTAQKENSRQFPRELDMEGKGGRNYPRVAEEQFTGTQEPGSETTFPEEGLIKQKCVY